MSQSETASQTGRTTTARRPSDRGLAIIEEAYCLVRAAPLSTLVVFHVGAVPFVAALFYFWADMSRSSFAVRDAAWSALVVALAYLWMKTAQAWFCRSLWSQLNPEGRLPAVASGAMVANLIAHALIQSLALPLLILSALFMVPFAWAYAFFHNATVLAVTRDVDSEPLRGLVARSAALSHWRWGANHVTMGITALAAFLVWANLIMFAVLAPQLLKWLFGVESVFTLFPLASLSNTTFLFATLLGAYLVMGPLTQAIYVMRCFYGDSRRSGVDLLSRLSSIRARSGQAGAGIVLLLICFVGVLPGLGDEPASSTVKVEAFDDAVHQTLESKPYQWRLSRSYDTAGLTDTSDEEKGLTSMIRRSFERFAESLKRLFATLFDPGRSKVGGGGNAIGADRGGKLAAALSILSLVLIASLLAWAVVQVRRRSRNARITSGTGNAGHDAGKAIDLENDDLVATQLPEDEWLRLAREQIGAGKFRLAIRASFLGSLAHLGQRSLLAVARHKSNRDYGRELDLKARSLPELRRAFSENVRQFEWAWYGDHHIDEAVAVRFAENCERIASESASGMAGLAQAELSSGEGRRA